MRGVWYTDTVEVGASASVGNNFGNGEFQRFVVVFPTDFASHFTSAPEAKPQVSYDGGEEWYDVAYSNNPNSASGLVLADFAKTSLSGYAVICEAFAFAKDYGRVKFSVAATQLASFRVGAFKE